MHSVFLSLVAIAFSLLSVGLTACSKMEAPEYVKLKIRPPSQASAKLAMIQAELAKPIPENRNEFSLNAGFGLTTPISVAEIGCYGVFIEYPELPISSSCVDSSSVPVAFPDDMFGLFPSAQTEFEIEVLSGADRLVHIIAFKETLGFCPFIKSNFDTVEENLSQPVLIGSEFVDVFAGVTEVDIFSSLAAGIILDDCTGALFNDFGEGVDPTQFPGLIAWFDVSDTSTVFSDDSCSVALSPGGGSAGCVTDKSGNGNNATQLTGVDRPNYNNFAMNGLPSIEFFGASDHLEITGGNAVNADNGTIFVVFETADNSTSVYRVLVGAQDTGADDVSIGINTVSHFLSFVVDSSQTDGGTLDVNSGNTELGILSWESTGGFRGLYLNDPSTLEASNTTGIVNSATQNLYIGALNNGGPINPYIGEIGEVIIYNRELTDSERNQIGNYLRTKWGTD